MRLLFALPAAISATLPGYSSTCDRAAGQLHINIPYENPTTAELLSFVAGSCSGSGASGTNHEYAHDASTSTATLSLNINGCGLNSVLYDTPYLTRNGEYYMATANVTLGVNDNGNDLIFYNAVVGAECGHRQDYTVTFDYHQNIVTADQTGCQVGPNDECVLPAFEIYNFTLLEYTDDSFNTAADSSNQQSQANEMIYLQLAATDLPADRKMAIKKCRFVDDSVEYPMFSPHESICDNRYIDLEWSYQNNANAANIAHRLFLLAAGDQDSYQLICDVKVCDRDDHSSECNAWAACLESSAQQSYVCDSLTCPANAHSCSVSADSAAQCSFECNCDNGVSDISIACAAQQCTSCDSGYTLTNGACVLNECTCANGVGTTGSACATHDTADCASCTSPYTLAGNSCELYDAEWTLPGTYDYEVRLSYTRYGHVMVWKNQAWHTVCDDSWSYHEPNDDVLCQQLHGVNAIGGDGHDATVAPFNYAAIISPQNDVSIWVDVYCSGNEASIADCSHSADFDASVCSGYEDVWVICEGASQNPATIRNAPLNARDEAKLAK